MLGSCAKKITSSTSNALLRLPVPVVEKPWPVSNTKQMEIMGAASYTAKCVRCHGLKKVENYSASNFTNIVDRMAPKAKLYSTEKINVLTYVRPMQKNKMLKFI